jgi:hypothetical protein
MESKPIVVPKGTKLLTVRAALTGQGKVWFDEIAVKEVHSEPTTHASADTLDRELLGKIDGKVLQVLPIDRDQMVLAYLPDWAHGQVDNIAVANNEGGVRTLIGWPPIDPKLIDNKFLLALYARETVSNGEAGPIGAYEVLEDWNEATSWAKQPKTADQPSTEFQFENAKGWHVFDVTKLATAQAKPKAPAHGVMLRFKDEKQTSETWSGYAFVSREGNGEWEARQPLLLIVK